MSLLYNKLIESVKTAIYESLFDDIDDIATDNDNVSTIIDKFGGDYNYVDLGLPSGTLWCNKNLGAKDETDPGDYYQWGYTEPVDKDCQIINSDDYTKFNPSGDNYTFTKYNKNNVHYQLDISDDAAYIETFSNYRIPTPKQWEELVQCCMWEFAEINGEDVYKIRSKKRGNKNFIYLPTGGIINDCLGYGDFSTLISTRTYDNLCGFYWTSYISKSVNSNAYADCFYFGKGHRRYGYTPEIVAMPRFYALNIRPVMNNN